MLYITEDNTGLDDELFVRSTDTDCFYRARPSFFFQVNQELGGLHAALLGCSLKTIYDEEKKTWMIIRTRMNIYSFPFWRDILSCLTWYQEGYKLYSPRFCEVKNKTTGEKVFDSTSHWIVMDIERMRPCRPDVFKDRLPYGNKEKFNKDPSLPPFPQKDEFLHKPIKDTKVTINYYDTDYNRHVNNISYINWSLDALPHEFLDSFKPKVMDTKWEKQTYFEDNLVVRTYSKEENLLNSKAPTLFSSIVRIKENGEEESVFSMVSEWEERGNKDK